MNNSDDRCRESVRNLETRVAELEQKLEKLLEIREIEVNHRAVAWEEYKKIGLLDKPKRGLCPCQNGCASSTCDNM